jgi:hypothetical protein
MIKLSANNVKIRKRTLQLLAKADKQLQQEKRYHEAHGQTFQPSAVQQQNERLWTEAKSTMPEEAAEAEAAAPGRRERFSDIFKSQMEMQQKLVQQYTEPISVDTALMARLASITNAAAPAHRAEGSHSAPTLSKKQRLNELTELLNDGTITQAEHDSARMRILSI